MTRMRPRKARRIGNAIKNSESSAMVKCVLSRGCCQAVLLLSTIKLVHSEAHNLQCPQYIKDNETKTR